MCLSKQLFEALTRPKGQLSSKCALLCVFSPAHNTLAASSPGEFALLPRLLAWHQQGLLQLQLYVTQSSSQGDADDAAAAFSDSLPPGVACHQGRITTAQLQTALEGLRQQPSQGVDAYVCGPPQMTDDVVEQLKGLGLPAADIRTEKWW